LLIIPGFFDPHYTLDDFALPIALMAGLLEAIPNVGPAITLILTSILAIGTNGAGTVLYVAVSFTVLQNLEAVFIVPMVMKRAIGIDPILSILGIIAGFQVAGVVGAILAIPLIGIAQIMVVAAANEYKRLEKQRPKLIE
jgi:predicted PurR-regulated permease PerM